MIIVSFYIYPRDICCILYPRDHCLFDDSNAWHLRMLWGWQVTRMKKLHVNLLDSEHGGSMDHWPLRQSVKILKNRTILWRAMVEALCLKEVYIWPRPFLPLMRHRACTIALHWTMFFVIFSASLHSGFTFRSSKFLEQKHFKKPMPRCK